MLNLKTFSSKKCSNKSAFSLIELSIVLIIIGLLIAGVTGGASLIKSAELRSLMNEARGWNVAVNNFYTQYDEMPGDFGTDIEPTDAPAHSETGDENDHIEFINDGGSSTTTSTNDVVEGVSAWSHLVNSDTIDDNLTIADADISIAASGALGVLTCGTELPESKIKNGCWVFDYGDTGSVYEDHNVVILTAGVGATTATADGSITNVTPVAVIDNADSLSIDIKMDDGNANTGEIRGTLSACDDVTAGTYDLTDTAKSCALSFEVDVLS